MRAAYNGVSYVFVVNDLLLIMSRIITSWDGPRRGTMPVFVAQSTLPNPSVSLEVTEGTECKAAEGFWALWVLFGPTVEPSCNG